MSDWNHKWELGRMGDSELTPEAQEFLDDFAEGKHLPNTSDPVRLALRQESERLKHDMERHLEISTELVNENESLRELEAQVEALKGRCRDMYANDDGEAWSQTADYFERQGWDIELPPPPTGESDEQ